MEKAIINSIIGILLFLLCFCSSKIKSTAIENLVSNVGPPPHADSVFWRRDKTVEISLDYNLSHQNGFKCDSAIGIDYVGFEGEHFFFPINDKGQYISTIIKTQKLNNRQIDKLNSILGDSLTYKNPRIVGCYNPRLSFVYFKDGKVIGQTQICLSCAQLRSTAMTIFNEYGGLFNAEATKKLDTLRLELGLNSKMKWE